MARLSGHLSPPDTAFPGGRRRRSSPALPLFHTRIPPHPFSSDFAGTFPVRTGRSHIPRFRPIGAKTHSFHCSSSPQRTRSAGLRRGPHFAPSRSTAQSRSKSALKAPSGAGTLPCPQRGTWRLTGRYTGRAACCRERRTAAERSGSIPPARTPDAGASSRRTETSFVLRENCNKYFY